MKAIDFLRCRDGVSNLPVPSCVLVLVEGDPRCPFVMLLEDCVGCIWAVFDDVSSRYWFRRLTDPDGSPAVDRWSLHIDPDAVLAAEVGDGGIPMLRVQADWSSPQPCNLDPATTRLLDLACSPRASLDRIKQQRFENDGRRMFDRSFWYAVECIAQMDEQADDAVA